MIHCSGLQWGAAGQPLTPPRILARMDRSARISRKRERHLEGTSGQGQQDRAQKTVEHAGKVAQRDAEARD